MNAKSIAWHLAVRNGPFHARRHLAVVPNVSWGLLQWEADLVVLTKSKFLYEIEIKISMADFKADANKWKFTKTAFEGGILGPSNAWELIKYFWYAAPLALALRHQEANVPSWAGVIGLTDSSIKIIKKPSVIPGCRKLTEVECTQLLRLGCLKAWNIAHKSNETIAASLELDRSYDVHGSPP